MFIKIVIVLLLLIVAASLLTGRSGKDATVPHRIRPQLRTLMLRVAVVLLLLSVAVAALHTFG